VVFFLLNGENASQGSKKKLNVEFPVPTSEDQWRRRRIGKDLPIPPVEGSF
jgi:hypothetical protein